MDNPETRAILDTRHRTKASKTKNNTENVKDEQHGHHQKQGMISPDWRNKDFTFN